MLETVEEFIREAINDETTFEKHFVNYMMKIQDENIDSEVLHSLKGSSMSNIVKANELIELDFRKLVKDR